MRPVILILLGAALSACAKAENHQSTASAKSLESKTAAVAPSSSQTSTPPAISTTAETSAPGSAGAAAGSDVSFPGSQVVTYVATDYAFDGPDRIPAGLTTFRLVNHGKELHHLQLVRLTGGKTANDLMQAMKDAGPESQPPPWVVDEGGPNAVAPGAGESNATAVLEPGTYVALCVIPSGDGTPHVAKGMLEPIEVVAEPNREEWTEPEADLTVQLVDYAFRLPEKVAPGRHVVRVENAGDEPHELTLWQLAPGKSLSDLLAWAGGGFQGEPPALPIGGIAGLKPGGHEYMVADLRAGDYAMLCFLPDDEDGKPHIAHGMVKQFTVG